jgi:metal iron transporter
MPHAFFIGSKMATMHRLDPSQYEDADEADEPDTNSSSNSPEKLKSSGANSRKAAGQRASWVAASSSRGPTLHLPQPMSLGDFNLGADRSPRSPASPFLAAERFQPRDEIRKTTTPPSTANPAVPFPASATSSSPNTSNDNSETKRLTPPSPPVPPPTSPPPKTRQSFKPSLACVKAHLPHAQADVAGSLLGFAILINSSILILAAAVFYYGEGKSTTSNGVSDLFDAYDLVKAYIGPGMFSFFFSSIPLLVFLLSKI